MMDELDLSRGMLSLAYTLGTLLGAAAQMPLGRAVDKFGGRVAISAFSACFALSLCALSLPRSWATLVLGFSAIRALGFGGLQLACATCLQQWYVRNRGLASGLSEAVSTFVGFGCYSALLSSLVSAHGWRRAYVLLGAVQLVTYTPLAAIAVRARPEDVGLLPDGGTHTAGRPVRLTAARERQGDGEGDGDGDGDGGEAGGDGGDDAAAADAKKETAAGAATAGGATDGWTLGDACRTLAFWLLASSNALAWGAGAGLFFHLASITSELGLPAEKLAVYIYLPWASARALSLVVSGRLLDRVQPRLVLSAGAGAAAVAYAMLGAPKANLRPPAAVAFAVVFGIGMGTCAAVFRVAPAHYFGRAHLGAIAGALQTTNVAATAMGPLLLGAIHDATASYALATRAMAAAMLLFSVLALALRVPRRRHAHGRGDRGLGGGLGGGLGLGGRRARAAASPSSRALAHCDGAAVHAIALAETNPQMRIDAVETHAPDVAVAARENR